MNQWTITTLIENHPDEERGLAGEHGLSMLIETEGFRLLMDTGDSGTFYDNAKKMGVNLKGLDGVLISHAHYDHAGGFLRFLKEEGNPSQLIVGKGFFRKCYLVREDGKMKFIGLRFDRRMLTDLGVNIQELQEDYKEIFPGLTLHRNFPQVYDWEPLDDSFVCQEEAPACFGGRCMDSMLFLPDRFTDETAVTLDTDQGLVMIVGCSHPGIMNMVATIENRTGKKVCGVIGGPHLMNSDRERVDKTMAAFQERELGLIALSHCTGEDYLPVLKETFGDRFVFNKTGNVMEF